MYELQDIVDEIDVFYKFSFFTKWIKKSKSKNLKFLFFLSARSISSTMAVFL
jgi:hypothetical protein